MPFYRHVSISLFIYINVYAQPEGMYGKHEKYGYLPWIEVYHQPDLIATAKPRYVDGSDYMVPEPWDSPDFRVPEPPWLAYKQWMYYESNRPYRMSPAGPRTWWWNWMRRKEDPHNTHCTCCTVFKRLTPLSTCAVITSKHILTTATATELVLQRYRNYFTLQNILGVWYDVSGIDYLNSSRYATPSRIHYHPEYLKPNRANRSHPLPVMNDLAVWTMTYSFSQGGGGKDETYICARGQSTRKEPTPSYPSANQLMFLMGYQFIWAYNRVPTPFHRYMIRLRMTEGVDGINPCPKTEWGWFICISGYDNAKYGFDSGALLFLLNEKSNWRQDGLGGVNAFSMKLRSLNILHYYTVVDTHKNLDFFYGAYNGRLPYEYLDHRFENTVWRSPLVKKGFFIEQSYQQAWQPTGFKVHDLWN